MKKNGLLFCLAILIFYACTKDDFCTINPVTPNLVLRFYNATDTSAVKATDSLYVWAEGKDSIITNLSTDSIAIPLNTANNNTVYYFAKGTQLQNKLTISYTTKDEFVSRSCGFRVIFNDVSFTNEVNGSNGWITSISPENLSTINNQNAAHIQVYH